MTNLSDPANARLEGARELEELLIAILPNAVLSLHRKALKDREAAMFSGLKAEVISYASAAAATDTLPILGLATVPTLQGTMLRGLANHFDVKWTRRAFQDLVGALGTGFAARYGVNLAGRQLMKLTPGWGQTAGTALSVAVSFATTYALGRAAVYYFFHRSLGSAIDEKHLRNTYRQALLSAGRNPAGQHPPEKSNT